MCVIVAIPPKAYLTKEIARRNWQINDDGGGFAYIKDGEFVIEKYMEWTPFWSAFERARSDNRDTAFIVHMRIATHGSVCLDNVHPFLSPDGSHVIAHNGVIKHVPDDPTRSDTRVFVEDVIPELGPKWYTKPFLASMVEDWIGWSKLTILDEEGLWVLNEDAGAWHEDMWFSNEYGLPWGKTKVTKGSGLKKAATVEVYDDMWEDADVAYGYWWDENQKIVKEGNIKGIVAATQKDYFEVVRSSLNELREKEGYIHPLDWDEQKHEWYCRGCLNDVDEDTGECSCYDLVDDVCGNLLGFCECEYADRSPQELGSHLWEGVS